MDFKTLLEEHAEQFQQLKIDSDQIVRLTSYLNRLWAANQELNLVSRKMTPLALVRDHLFDSLIALAYLPRAKIVADLGSGGGLPAIPLAVCGPDLRLLLFEKSPRKCAFLEGLRDEFPNTEIHQRLEENCLPKRVDLVVARGFKPIHSIISLTQSYYKAGGRYMLYKGRMQKILEELETARLPASSYRLQELKSVGDAEERHLVLIND